MLEQLQLLAQPLGEGLRRRPAARVGAQIVEEVVDALEVGPLAVGPGDRAGADAQHLLHLGEQLEWLASDAVHLVDEGEDGDAAHAAYFEEFFSLRLDAL